jgi:hypothetical protein
MERKIAPVVHKRKLSEPESDFGYLQQQPYEARLTVLEEIRHDYHVWLASLQGNNEYVKPAFQKVFRIIKMSDLGSDNQ